MPDQKPHPTVRILAPEDYSSVGAPSGRQYKIVDGAFDCHPDDVAGLLDDKSFALAPERKVAPRKPARPEGSVAPGPYSALSRTELYALLKERGIAIALVASKPSDFIIAALTDHDRVQAAARAGMDGQQ